LARNWYAKLTVVFIMPAPCCRMEEETECRLTVSTCLPPLRERFSMKNCWLRL
jgi:hypothetical protein